MPYSTFQEDQEAEQERRRRLLQHSWDKIEMMFGYACLAAVTIAIFWTISSIWIQTKATYSTGIDQQGKPYCYSMEKEHPCPVFVQAPYVIQTQETR